MPSSDAWRSPAFMDNRIRHRGVRRRDRPDEHGLDQRNLELRRTPLRACDSVGAHVIGDDFASSCTFRTALLATSTTGRIEIGHGVTINYGSSITAASRVRLGDRVMVRPYCVVGDTEGLLLLEEEGEPIEIGDDVWLAGRVIVRPGARIGPGTVVAAGSVVEGDIPANAIVSGAPARVLRVRASGVPARPVGSADEDHLAPGSVHDAQVVRLRASTARLPS